MGSPDIVVVGGRVAGAAVALLLARTGARVALVRRGGPPSSGGPGRPEGEAPHPLLRLGVLQLARWGLLGRLAELGTPAVSRLVVHYRDGAHIQVSLRSRAGLPAVYAPRTDLLSGVLIEAAAASGVEVMSGLTVTGLVRDRTGRVGGVTTLDAAGRRVDIRGRITVGADGRNSTVAALVGAADLRRGSARSAGLARDLPGLTRAGLEWAYGDRAVAGLVPSDRGTHLVVATTPGRLGASLATGPDQALATLLTAAGAPFRDEVTAAEAAGPVRAWRDLPSLARQSWGPGWALVGRAGSSRDTVFTFGADDELRDAELLADRLTAVICGAVPEAVALASYQSARERLTTPLAAVTEEAARYDWDADGARSVFRRVSSAHSDDVDHVTSLRWRPAGRSRSGQEPSGRASASSQAGGEAP